MGKTEIQGKEAGPVGGGGGGCPPTSAASVGKDHRGGQRSIIEEKRQPDNVSDLFRARVGDFRNEILHGRAGDDCCWTGATFRDVSLAVVQISQNLQNYGCRAGSRIGVCGDNSPQWMELFYACSFFSGICVAVDRNCKGPDLASAIEHTNMEILVTCSSKVGDVISAINDNKEESDRAWQLHTIVVWGCDDPFKLRLYNQAVASRGISLIGWEEFLDSTHMITHPDTPPSASDPHVIFYSAGQKATVVHHGALVASIYSLTDFVRKHFPHKKGSEVSYLSVAPMSSFAGLTMHGAVLNIGGRITYRQRGVTLLDDIRAARPTLFCGSADDIENLYQIAVPSRPSFNWRGLFGMKKHWGWIFFSRLLKNFLPGISHESDMRSIRMTISTHHHLSFYLLDFFTSLGIPVVKTYTSNQIGVASLTLPSKNSMDGSKNGFLLGSGDMELRLVDSEGKIVEQSEDCDATGKVCLKGPSIFQGYLEGGNRNPTGALDKDGYFHTGETGQLLQDGKFRILGRHERVSLQ